MSGPRAFWQARRAALWSSPAARGGIAAYHRAVRAERGTAPPEAVAFDETLDALLEEAETAAPLALGHRGALLEVGGGFGLLHAWLRATGHDAYALEPSGPGFAQSFAIGRAVLAVAGVDDRRWFDLPATEVKRLERPFDLIFSHNMLEHVDDVAATLGALGEVLAPGGRMVQHTVNYRIPYEPHFRIPLVPGAPRLTARLRPALRRSPMWQGLNFLTPVEVERACARAGLAVRFEGGILAGALARLDTDPNFRRRHGALYPAWRALRAAGLTGLVARVPARWVTPMRFTAWRP